MIWRNTTYTSTRRRSDIALLTDWVVALPATVRCINVVFINATVRLFFKGHVVVHKQYVLSLPLVRPGISQLVEFDSGDWILVVVVPVVDEAVCYSRIV